MRALYACAQILDSAAEIERLLRHVFARGAKRVRLVDAALAALRSAGLRSGTVLSFDLHHTAAACVVDGVPGGLDKAGL